MTNIESNIESNNIYQQFFSLSNDLLCVTNETGYFQIVNPSFSRILGYSEQELLSTPVLDFVHPDDVDRTIQQIEKLKKSQHALCFENRYRHKNNSYLTFSWHGYIDPATQLIYSTARDITDEIKIQSTLKNIQNALEQETIYAETDVRGIITKVNDKFCDISGYSKEELIGSTHKLINSGHHTRAFFKNLWKSISSGKVWSGTIKNQKKNGDYYYVQSILLPILDHNNQITKYIAIRQDITEQVNSESQHLKSLKILSETSSAAKVGGWEMDVATGVLSWTDETFRILEVEMVDGLTPKLPEGLQLFLDKDQPKIEKAVRRAAEFGEPYALELKAHTPKGNIKWIYTNGKATYKKSKIVSISGTIQDIHERKMTEIKANKEKQKSVINGKFAALGELSASIAHEINNPLGVISGYAEILQSKNSAITSKELSSKSAIILKSCDRIAHIVKSLKKFSRTDEESPYATCSLSDLVHEATILTQPKLKFRMIKLNYTSVEACNIWCNEIEIEQVIVNLINNAIDAISALSDKWIDISITENERHCQMSITDSGTGIALKDQSSIFEPFVTTKGATEGTGLGLSIVKGILDNHGATISIDNNSPNTCFVICFSKTDKI